MKFISTKDKEGNSICDDNFILDPDYRPQKY